MKENFISGSWKDGQREEGDVFETLSPWLKDILHESNLIALQEGLQAFLAYAKYSPEIK